jgi:hypothetical protein
MDRILPRASLHLGQGSSGLRMKGDRTRQSILERAVDIASVEGLEGLTIGRLADDLGMSKSELFAHFGSKVTSMPGLTRSSSRSRSTRCSSARTTRISSATTSERSSARRGRSKIGRRPCGRGREEDSRPRVRPELVISQSSPGSAPSVSQLAQPRQITPAPPITSANLQAISAMMRRITGSSPPASGRLRRSPSEHRESCDRPERP